MRVLTGNINIFYYPDYFILFFEKGSFAIPFTGNNTLDTKLVAIIYDYNQSSEIEGNDTVVIPVYQLTEEINIIGHGLSEVKIANFLDYLTCGESWFVDVASKCGFLDFNFINNNEVSKKLNNSAYNLLIWPGYDLYYPTSYSFFEVIFDIPTMRNRAIRDFVGNGGGFVGSCYAGYMAARGMQPFPVFPAILTQNPNLPSFGILSISDIFFFMFGL